jgi:hypothetical protein
MSYLDDLGVAATRPQVQGRPPVFQIFKFIQIHIHIQSYSNSYSNRFKHREVNGQKQWPRGEPKAQWLLHGLGAVNSIQKIENQSAPQQLFVRRPSVCLW